MGDIQSIPPMRVLWIGPWHSDKALYGRKAVNQAATEWSRGLLNALVETGCMVHICSHCYEQFWPRGRLSPGDAADFDFSLPLRVARYINLPFVRSVTLSIAYRQVVVQEIEAFHPDVILSYNVTSFLNVCLENHKLKNVRWFPIILDQNDPTPDNWCEFMRQTTNASGLIFLSFWGFQHYPGSLPRVHFDGGVEKWNGEKNANHDGVIVYSGKYDDQYGGLDLLFEMFREVQAPQCRFILTGKDATGRLPKYLRQEPRAEYRGFLRQADLHALHCSASVFVNPRPPGISDNRMAFPSKLFRYLSYGKPVVSTWTDGLAPDYRDLLWVPEDNTPSAYAALIEQALFLGEDSRGALSEKIRLWVQAHIWQIQVERLCRWLEEIRK